MRAEVSKGGDFELPPAGMHLARCIKVIDLGTQAQKYKGQEKDVHQILVMFELPKVMIEIDGEEKPQAISSKYTLSFNKKARLRKDLESWYGVQFNDKDIQDSGGFDPAKILGKPATLTIVHSEDGNYANIASITGVMDGVDVPDQVNKSVLFDLSNFDSSIWDSFSDGMKNWILRSPEAQLVVNGKSDPDQQSAVTDPELNDLPF